MKRYLLIIMCILTLAVFAGCNNGTAVIRANVIEIHDNSVLVRVVEDSSALKNGDMVNVTYSKTVSFDASKVKTGSLVKISYLDKVIETYPMGITAYKIELIDQ